MSNIVIDPSSGILEFNTGTTYGSAFDNSLVGAARLEFKNSGQLALTSYGTGVSEKLTIDGSNGRLFTVDNEVTGSIFSVNDAAGLPIVEVFSDDRVVMGEFASDALVVSGSSVQVTGSQIASQSWVEDQGYAVPNLNEGRLFVGNSSNEAVADDTVFVDIASGNVGIGTTSPSQKLHAVGSQVRLDGNGGGFYKHTLAGAFRAAFYDDGATTKIFADGDGSNPHMTFNAGNVGIGTTSPSQKLHVVGSQVRLDGNGGGFYQHTLAGAFRAAFCDDGAITKIFADGDGNNPHMTFNAGLVGIGTTSPEDKLDIVGRLRISDHKTANTNKTNRIRGEHYNIAEEPHTFMFMNSFSTSSHLYIGGGSSIENAATSLKFFTAANNTTVAGTERMCIDSSGNVGIGVTNPDSSLHVTTNSSSGTFRLSPQNGTYEEYRLDIVTRAVDNGALTMKLKDNTFLKTYGFYNLTGISHGVAGYEDLLHLKNTGKVGIGTTSPQEKLDVDGHIKSEGLHIGTPYAGKLSISGNFRHSDGGGIASLIYNSESSSGERPSGLNVRAGVNGYNSFSLYAVDRNANPILLAHGNGNVGIGMSSTSYPSEKLEVIGNIKASGFINYAAKTVAETNAMTGMVAGSSVYVTDETGGSVMATYDGTNWRRSTDRAIIS